MSRARLALLTLVVVLSVGAMLAPGASAAINFEWNVGGKALAAGEKKVFGVETDGKLFDLSGKVGTSSVLLLSSTLNISPDGLILGGRPGTNEETLEFTNVTVASPAGCTVESLPFPEEGKIKTERLRSEIVEGQSGGKGNDEPLILLTPKTAGDPFTEVRFLNATGKTCPINLKEGSLTGSVLALPSPLKKEVERGDWLFEAVTKEYLVAAGGAAKTAGLVLAGNAATLTGLTLVFLEPKEAFGAF
jgi:hypothetical protein